MLPKIKADAHATRRHNIALLLASTALVGMVGQAFAVDWTGANSSDWNDGGNWSTGVKPDSTSTATVNGTVEVDGVMVQIDNLDVGSGGTGDLQIKNGTAFEVLSNTTIGVGPGDSGVVTVDGSSWDGDALFVGSFGTGTLTFQNGATGNNTTVDVGYFPGSTGTVTVDGSGTTWTLTGNANFGVQGLQAQGNLNITNGGKMIGTNAYFGGNAGSTGTASISGANSALTLSGELSVGLLGFGSMSITNGGTVSDVDGKIGVSQGYANTVIVDGPGSTWTNSGDLTIAENLNSSGDLTISNGGKVTAQNVLLGGSSDAYGTVTVSGANSLLAATHDFQVGDHGSGALTILDGGTVTAGGDLDITSDSTYKVGVGGQNSADPLHVIGQAHFNGSAVQVQVTPGGYSAGTAYTIVTADGGVMDTFGSVNANFAFLTPQLTYDANHAFVTLIGNGTSFGSIGATPNQQATGSGADTLGSGNALYDTISLLSVADAQQAFDELSGEIHASAKGALLDNSSLVRNATLGRLQQSFGALGDTGDMASGYAQVPVVSAHSDADTAMWGHIYGGFRHSDSDGNAAATSSKAAGLVLGVDGLLSDWRIGLLANAGLTDLSVRDRSSSGTSGDYGLGVYAGTQWSDTKLSFGAAYTRHEVSTSRTVAIPGMTDTLTADYSAATTQLFGELGHEFDFGATTLEPFGQAAYVRQSTDGFTEQGGIGALISSGDVIDSTFTTIGLRASHDVALGETLAKLSASVGWQHAFADPVQNTASFAGGTAFTVAGTPIASNALALGAQMVFDLNATTSLGLSYDGQIASNDQAHSLQARFSSAF